MEPSPSCKQSAVTKENNSSCTWARHAVKTPCPVEALSLLVHVRCLPSIALHRLLTEHMNAADQQPPKRHRSVHPQQEGRFGQSRHHHCPAARKQTHLEKTRVGIQHTMKSYQSTRPYANAKWLTILPKRATMQQYTHSRACITTVKRQQLNVAIPARWCSSPSTSLHQMPSARRYATSLC